MDRRTFLSAASAAMLTQVVPAAAYGADDKQGPVKPMAVGLLVSPSGIPRRSFAAYTTSDLIIAFCTRQTCRLIHGRLASQMKDMLHKYEVIATTVEVVGPPPLEWNFLRGPSTIGLVPPATRAARIDALRQASDFAKLLGVSQVQTHCGFIPEDPADALYPGTVEAIRTVAQHCHENGQYFLMETGQETPTTMSRMIRDVGMPNLAVGLDTANLILYGKANPVDAVDILGPHVRSIHAKDGKWPTDPSQLGEEVLIGKGLVDFRAVFTKLHRIGYQGAVTIERETSGPQQIEDVRQEKQYLENILKEVLV